MKQHEGWFMYTKIHEFKKVGLNKSQIARRLDLSRNTVYKLLNMTPYEYEEYKKSLKQRSKKLSDFHQIILTLLRQYPEMSSAQIMDRLIEKYGDINCCEGTVRNYVNNLRAKYNIPKSKSVRQYQAVDEMPPGYQIQVDFGEITVQNQNKINVKLHFIAFLLSHSRYKYVEWLDRPFTTADVVNAHENAFDFMGGMPIEIVYDQDSVLLVNENLGDLIYTKEFNNYINKRKFKVYMCRKADPETKGKIENVVRFVKGNFARHRIFYNLEKWNEDCIKWLERTGNGKVHNTTKKIPAEVFVLEKQHLQPIPEKIKNKLDISVLYTVKKDNTVSYKSNRYQLPLNTYKGPNTQVKITVSKGKLVIKDVETDSEIMTYNICTDKGCLIKNTNLKRDYSKKINEYIDYVLSLFPGNCREKTKGFIQEIYQHKPRYIRDHLQALQLCIENVHPEVVDKTLNYCIKNGLYSAVDFKDAMDHYNSIPLKDKRKGIDFTPINDEIDQKIKSKPKIRDIGEYTALLEGGDVI